MPPPQDHRERLAALWRGTVHAPARRVALASLFATVLAAAHLARQGTTEARLGAAGAVVTVAALAIALAVRRRRSLADLRRTIGSVVRRADPLVAERALRALTLIERADTDPSAGSRELAELHLRRVLSRVSESRVRLFAEGHGRRLQGFALVAATCGFFAFAFAPFRVIEGFDVLFARHGLAPLPLPYIDELRVEVHPPDYLHQKDRRMREDAAHMEAPYGSLVTVRGVPLRSGRVLVLTDGTVEVPFVDDGAGGVAARWPLGASTSLSVAARLGHVRVTQGDGVAISSIPDRIPVVTLEGAPRTAALIDQSEVPIVYKATDDHGLREVHLVLRAGAEEDRRVLAKLDGDTREDRGGYQLRSTDPFIRRSFLPIEVTVQARDNDPLTGPKWGVSPAITLVPAAIGEPEARRYDALVAARDALVDLLAHRLEVKPPPPATPASREFVADEARRLEEAVKVLRGALAGKYGDLTVSRRFSALAEGQLAKLGAAMREERKAPSPTTHKASVTMSETLLLALDRGVRSLSTRDAQSAAKRLSRVATEAADGFQMASSKTDEARGLQRAAAAIAVIEPSGAAIARLGQLGGDLGGIVKNDLRRIRRATSGGDLAHAELAARDLAARLARPAPSFAGGGRGSTESGGGQPEPGDETPSDADESFDAEEQAIDKLVKDHAENLEDVQQALHRATGEGNDAFLEEAKKHAAAVRESLEKLPRAEDQDGPAAAARDQVKQMAEALERGDAKGAVDAGRAAEKSLDEAQQAASDDDLSVQRLRQKAVAKSAKEAGGKLSPEVRWAENALEQMRRKMQEAGKLGDAADRESRLADRARGQTPGGKPGDAASEALKRAEASMRQGSRALGKGDAEKGLEEMREAQRALEAAKKPKDEGADGQPGGDKDDGKNAPSAGPANIPKADEHKGPEEFRKRVQEGMGKGSSPSLKDAVRRYTERLLR